MSFLGRPLTPAEIASGIEGASVSPKAQAAAAAAYLSPSKVALRTAEAAGPSIEEKIAAAVAAHNATVAALNAGYTPEVAAKTGSDAGLNAIEATKKAASMSGGRRRQSRNRRQSRRSRRSRRHR